MTTTTIEKRLWEAADRLWANSALQPSEYAVPVLALILLKYADHRFAVAEKQLAGKARRSAIGKDDYHALGAPYLPADARFGKLLERHDVGRAIHDAMKMAEAENEDLGDVFPREYDRLDPDTLRELLRIFDSIPADADGGTFEDIFDYFLRELAQASSQRGGEYYTPVAVSRLIVDVLEPLHGRIYDPACGSGGMFVQSARFVAEHEKSPSSEIGVFGVERIAATQRLCKMNLAVHRLLGDIQLGNSHYQDPHDSTGRFDFVMANPPFNQSAVDKARAVDDRRRYPFGVPSADNANYLWIQLFYSALNGSGRAGFVMANSAGDSRGGDLEIRRRLLETGAVDAIVTISPGFFSFSSLPVTLWFLDKGKTRGDRREKVLFLDARHVFRRVDRRHRDFAPEQIEYLANIVRMHRDGALSTAQGSADLLEATFPTRKYRDVPGLCKVATLGEIESSGWSLNPGRYVGLAATTTMRLRGLRLSNVYGFQELAIRFPERGATVLVGANGAGKSTVLDGIAMFLAPLAALLQGTNARGAPYGLGKDVIHVDADQAAAALDVDAGGAEQTWDLATDRAAGKPGVSAAMTQWARQLRASLEGGDSTPAPVLRYYPSVRFYLHEEPSRRHPRPSAAAIPQVAAYNNAFEMGQQSFGGVAGWFRREEDLENEVRVGSGGEYVSPRLGGVRQAVLRFMDKLSGGTANAFDNLRVRRDPEDTSRAKLVLRKDGKELPLDALSDGERGSIVLVADLAQRLVTANPGAPDPLSCAGIVLIDEIELHLHPRWQREILPALVETFPGCQFIVTTHSPQVLSRVPRDQILLFSRFKHVDGLPHTEGRDTNAILTELMGVSSRPEEAGKEIDALARLIDEEDLAAARLKLAALEERFGPRDRNLLRLGSMLRVLEQDEP